MINYIWYGLLLIGISFSIFLKKDVSSLLLFSIEDGINLVLEMAPILIFWMGLTNIALKSGLLDKFAKFIRPLLKKILPSVKNDEALNYIASNVACNAIGLGSAATPFGLKAMEVLQEENEKKDTASDAMITFLVLNTSGVTVIPTTVIALRMASGSANPAEIVITSILATTLASAGGLFVDYLIRRRNKK